MSLFNLKNSLRRVDSEVAETELEGCIVLLHIEHGSYYNFNATASDLWRWLNEPILLSELVDKLHAKYECSWEQSHFDVLQLLEELRQAKLLEVKE